MVGEKRFIFKGKKFPDPQLNPIIYQPEFFQMALDLESEVFHELRKKNNILPHKINESNDIELSNIRSFFDFNKNTFYFLFDNDNLIGDILFIKNYIQALSIAIPYQRKGFGTMLTIFAINKIIDNGYDSVELNTLLGNIEAEELYKKIGFIEIKS